MRLVACDLDGTIVRRDGSVTVRTAAALAACERAGVRVVFVTGRPPRWMAPVADATGHHGVAVCANGAIVYDMGTERVVRTRAMPTATVREVARLVRRAVPGGAFAVETMDGFRREPDYRPRRGLGADPVGPLEELLDGGAVVVKLLYRVEAGVADDMLAAARTALDGLAEPVHSDGASGMLEIAAAGVSKASTLAELAAQDGIGPEEVVAFGDMPNDVPMFLWAGVGYAMGGGHPEAVAAADRTAPRCEDDGVAQVLERLLRLRLRSSASGRP
jgi:Cof subfamily protein (haloacid dehalogenase superfamily)